MKICRQCCFCALNLLRTQASIILNWRINGPLKLTDRESPRMAPFPSILMVFLMLLTESHLWLKVLSIVHPSPRTLVVIPVLLHFAYIYCINTNTPDWTCNCLKLYRILTGKRKEKKKHFVFVCWFPYMIMCNITHFNCFIFFVLFLGILRIERFPNGESRQTKNSRSFSLSHREQSLSTPQNRPY